MELGGGTGPRYAINVDVSSATVTVGTARELLVERTPIVDKQWVGGPVHGRILVQTSAHGSARWAVVDSGEVCWEEPHRRVAPGQSVVFYEGEEIAGGGLAA